MFVRVMLGSCARVCDVAVCTMRAKQALTKPLCKHFATVDISQGLSRQY